MSTDLSHMVKWMTRLSVDDSHSPELLYTALVEFHGHKTAERLSAGLYTPPLPPLPKERRWAMQVYLRCLATFEPRL